MSISLTKKLFITWYTLLMLATGWTIGPVLATWMPGHYFEWYPFIPVFFYIFGWFTIYMFEACRRYAPQKLQLVYLGTKGIKMFFSLIILLIFETVENLEKSHKQGDEKPSAVQVGGITVSLY